MITRTDTFHYLYSDEQEDDMTNTAEKVAGPMDAFEFSDRLASLLLGDQTHDEALSVTQALFFAAAGVLTTNDGLVVRLADGSEYQVTVVRSR